MTKQNAFDAQFQGKSLAKQEQERQIEALKAVLVDPEATPETRASVAQLLQEKQATQEQSKSQPEPGDTEFNALETWDSLEEAYAAWEGVPSYCNEQIVLLAAVPVLPCDLTVRIDTRQSPDGQVLTSSYAIKHDWRDAEKFVKSQCQHYTRQGFYVHWLITDNVDTEEGDCKPARCSCGFPLCSFCGECHSLHCARGRLPGIECIEAMDARPAQMRVAVPGGFTPEERSILAEEPQGYTKEEKRLLEGYGEDILAEQEYHYCRGLRI